MTFPTNDPGHDREIMRRIYCQEMERARRDRFSGILVMVLCAIVTICSIAIIILS